MFDHGVHLYRNVATLPEREWYSLQPARSFESRKIQHFMQLKTIPINEAGELSKQLVPLNDTRWQHSIRSECCSAPLTPLPKIKSVYFVSVCLPHSLGPPVHHAFNLNPRNEQGRTRFRGHVSFGLFTFKFFSDARVLTENTTVLSNAISRQAFLAYFRKWWDHTLIFVSKILDLVGPPWVDVYGTEWST